MYKEKSFNDSHLHFVGIGANILEYVDLTKSKSFKDIKDTLSDELHRSIIVSRGWHENNFSDDLPFTKDVLDAVSKDIPIISIRTCGHVLICNEKMISIAGLSANSKQVDGGTFNLNTGEFTENALELIYKFIPKPSKDRIKEYMIAANQYLLSNGVTACGSDDFSTLPVHYETIIECYKELYAEHKLQVRIYQQVNLPTLDLLNDFIDKGYVNKKFGQFKFGPLKLLADGSLGGRTALLKEPYSDDKSTSGISVFTQTELDELVYLADSNNMDVAIHAIGDLCVDMVIESIQKSHLKTKRIHRHSIIHNQLANRSQIDTMQKLNIAAQTQPIFLNSDIPIIKNRLGNRYEESYLFKTMYKKGLKTTISTDCPVEPLNPFYNLYCATTRKSIKFPDYKPFLIDEAFTIQEAMQLYTVSPYYLSYDEDNTFDDYIIVDRDIYKCSKEELMDTQVLETYIDNKLVYKK